jgi:hypothetical protein
MKKSNIDQMVCSLARALAQVGDPWRLLIMKEIMLGNRRLNSQADGDVLPLTFFAARGAGKGADRTAHALFAATVTL